MKVGIITYHRAHNYGAVLQCYALQEILKQLGYDACVIDYRQVFIENLYRPSKKKMLIKYKYHPRVLLGLIKLFYKLEKRKLRFKSFCNKFMNLTEPCHSDNIPDCDVYIVGSDQMWSIDCAGGKIDPVYFGNFKRTTNSKLIGFSISTNRSSIGRLDKDIKLYLNNFNSISFREQFIVDSIKNLVGQDYPVTLDPTLCAGPELWDDVVNIKWKNKKYVAVYHVTLRSDHNIYEKILLQARRIASINNWDVVNLSTGDFKVQDFVSVIKYAQCVVTSSFHATVFSVIFSRPLFTIMLHDGNDGRYVNLLTSINMRGALVDIDFTDGKPCSFDYENIHSKLSVLRAPSIEYLINNISI